MLQLTEKAVAESDEPPDRFQGIDDAQGRRLKRVGKVPEWQILQQRGNLQQKSSDPNGPH